MSRIKDPDLYLPIDDWGWIPNTITIPTNGEIPIHAMTWNDDLLLRNPDGLMNGSAMATIIARRVPNIKAPWLIPEHQYSRIVSALHVATHGNTIDMSYTCPHCKAHNDVILGTDALLSQNRSISKTFTVNQLEFTVSPLSYQDLIALRNYDYRLLKMLSAVSIDRKIGYDPKIIQSEMLSHEDSVLKLKHKRVKQIKVSDQVVTDQTMITEFLFNAERDIQIEIYENLNNINDALRPQAQTVKCQECQKENTITPTLDASEDFRNRLLNIADSEIQDYFETLDKQSKVIRQEAAKMGWFMRGGATYLDILEMSPNERAAIVSTINDNLETSKKSKQLII